MTWSLASILSFFGAATDLRITKTREMVRMTRTPTGTRLAFSLWVWVPNTLPLFAQTTFCEFLSSYLLNTVHFASRIIAYRPGKFGLAGRQVGGREMLAERQKKYTWRGGGVWLRGNMATGSRTRFQTRCSTINKDVDEPKNDKDAMLKWHACLYELVVITDFWASWGRFIHHRDTTTTAWSSMIFYFSCEPTALK